MKFADFRKQVNAIIEGNKSLEESQKAITVLLNEILELPSATNSGQRINRQDLMKKLKAFTDEKGIELSLTHEQCTHLDIASSVFTVAPQQSSMDESARKALEAAEAKEQAIEALRVKINPYLIKFKDDLNEKLDKKAYKDEVANIQQRIQELLEPLLETPDQENLKKFQGECEQLLEEKKKVFKQTPAIWHDVIRPALMFLLGIIPMIVTAPLRLCNSEVPGKVHKFFYVKPDSPAFKAVKEESEKLTDEVTSTLGLGASAGA